MPPKLTTSALYTSPLPPEGLIASLGAKVEKSDEGFQLISKLSPGGVVVRTLRAPESDLPWFGTCDARRFSVALIPKDKSASPFQPILRGTVSPLGEGSLIALALAPHPDVRLFSGLFIVGGLLLGAASLLALTRSMGMGILGLAFAALFLAFPNFRARVSFEDGCQRSLAAFESQLDVMRQEDPPS